MNVANLQDVQGQGLNRRCRPGFENRGKGGDDLGEGVRALTG